MSHKQPRPLIVVHPDVATDDVRRALSRAGYAVIVSDSPKLFTALDVQSYATTEMIAQAGLTVLKEASGICVDTRDLRARFARIILDKMTAEFERDEEQVNSEQAGA